MEFKIKDLLKQSRSVFKLIAGRYRRLKEDQDFISSKLVMFISLSLLLFLCANFTLASQTVPGKTWEKVKNPRELGYSPEKLEAARKFAEENLDTAAVVIVVDGKILYEWGEVDRKFFTHSVRKSFMSALYGDYVHKGIIDLDKTMKDLGIDDKPPLTEEEKTATVRDCLKATSGVYHDALAESAAMRALKPERHSHKPGTYWCYNNWDFNVLCTIFEQETGKKFYEALKEDIADPIQMEDFEVKDGQYMRGEASIHPAYHFIITARDMARFGLLMLRNGNWNGKQVIPAEWVKESTSYHSDASLYGTDGYGYMWWVAKDNNRYPHLPFAQLKEGTFSARGAYGHYILVIPEYDMVAVHRVNSFERRNSVSGTGMGLLLRKILEAGPGEIISLPSLNTQILDTYVGKYEYVDQPGVVITVTRKDGALIVKKAGRPTLELFAESETEFYALEVGLKVRFIKNDKGVVNKLELSQLNIESTAKRIE